MSHAAFMLVLLLNCAVIAKTFQHPGFHHDPILHMFYTTHSWNISHKATPYLQYTHIVYHHFLSSSFWLCSYVLLNAVMVSRTLFKKTHLSSSLPNIKLSAVVRLGCCVYALSCTREHTFPWPAESASLDQLAIIPILLSKRIWLLLFWKETWSNRTYSEHIISKACWWDPLVR